MASYSLTNKPFKTANQKINTLIGLIVIYDMLGNEVLSTYSTGIVDVSPLERGIYFAVQNGEKTKLVIE